MSATGNVDDPRWCIWRRSCCQLVEEQQRQREIVQVIQRKGHDGFGNGNFQALFDAIEADQRERGYL